MKGNIAVALPKKLTKKVLGMQKDLNLKTPGEVIVKALSLLELSMGRKIELKNKKETLKIDTFEGLRQSVKVLSIEDID